MAVVSRGVELVVLPEEIPLSVLRKASEAIICISVMFSCIVGSEQLWRVMFIIVLLTGVIVILQLSEVHVVLLVCVGGALLWLLSPLLAITSGTTGLGST